MQPNPYTLVALMALLATVAPRQIKAEGFLTQKPIGQKTAHAVYEPPAPDVSAEDLSRVKQRLLQIDALRAGTNTPFVEIEKQCRELLRLYTLPDERAQIFFELAHSYAQSDIRLHSERVIRYARLALASERDPVQRGILYSYLGSAAEVDPTRLTFAEQRKQAAQAWLLGYKELLPFHLPAIAPELPPVGKFVDDTVDLSQREKALKKHTEQMQARLEAERLRTLVENRDVFVRQLREVYAREPRADEEIKHLATDVLRDRQAAEDFLAQILKK